MRFRFVPCALIVWLVVAASPLFAHHSFDTEFDTNKAIRIQGKVTKIEWANPHVYIELDVVNPNGTTSSWKAELTSINDLVTSGMTRYTLAVDSVVIVDGFAAKSGDRLVGTTLITVQATGRAFAPSQDKWHHSYAMEYDATSSIRITGTVTAVDRTSTKSTVTLSVNAANGNREIWQMDAPRLLSVDFGDVVQVSGNGTRDKSKKVFARSVNLLSRDGKAFLVPQPLNMDTSVVNNTSTSTGRALR